MATEIFRREGEYWTVKYAGITGRLHDSKGLRYLGHLLSVPGTAVASWELLALASSHAGANGGSRKSDGGETNAAVAPDLQGTERARVTVTKSIKAALTRIREHNPTLADHLDATVRRGYLCVYRPDPRVPMRWETH